MENPLSLHTDTTTNGIREIAYVSYLREDFVDRVLRIRLNAAMQIVSLFFSSNTYGTCSWENGTGITDVHRWEDEESVQNISTLSRHYPSLLLNGEMPNDYGHSIIEDVLSALKDDALAQKIQEVIESTEYREQVTLQQILPPEHNR